MGAVWGVVKKGLALALAMAEKGVFVLQGHGNPQQVRERAALFGSGSSTSRYVKDAGRS